MEAQTDRRPTVNIQPRDSATRGWFYWVGPFEETWIELGDRAHHWDVEENDGSGSLLEGFVGVDAEGYPTIQEGREFVYVDEFAACKCCGGSGLRSGDKLQLRP